MSNCKNSPKQPDVIRILCFCTFIENNGTVFNTIMHCNWTLSLSVFVLCLIVLQAFCVLDLCSFCTILSCVSAILSRFLSFLLLSPAYGHSHLLPVSLSPAVFHLISGPQFLPCGAFVFFCVLTPCLVSFVPPSAHLFLSGDLSLSSSKIFCCHIHLCVV